MTTHRRKNARGAAVVRLGTKLRRSVAALAFLVVVLLLAWAAGIRSLAPYANTTRERFDAIVVFGAPSSSSGAPTPAQLARVSEAVHEYERGVAPRLILTGGAVRNAHVESRVLAQIALADGLPASVLYLDTESRDTIQNGCQARKIMQAHGWRSAELLSDEAQLPRIALIFKDSPLEWRLHAAPPLEPRSGWRNSLPPALETLKTLRYLLWTRQRERCAP